MHILLVEDNVGDARLLYEALREQCLSCQISVVEDGEQAVALFHRGESPRVTFLAHPGRRSYCPDG